MSIDEPCMTSEDVLSLVMHKIETLGGQKAFAQNFNLSVQYVNDVVRGRREPGEKFLNALGLEKVIYYVRKK